MPRHDEVDALEERLARQVARTSVGYGVLAPDDRVLVALSGGKDSYALLLLLERLRPRLPFAVELRAVHIDQRAPGHDASPLRRWADATGRGLEIVEDDIWSVVERNTTEGGTSCAICSRLRRGALYTAAARLGCNKVALGHHRDDALATLLLNLFYGGKLQAMPARYTTDDGRFEVIRPMIELAEADLAELSRLRRCPILPCRVCGERTDLKRVAVGRLIEELEREHPRLRQVMLGAIKNIHPSHLLDRELLELLHDRQPGAR